MRPERAGPSTKPVRNDRVREWHQTAAEGTDGVADDEHTLVDRTHPRKLTRHMKATSEQQDTVVQQWKKQ